VCGWQCKGGSGRCVWVGGGGQTSCKPPLQGRHSYFATKNGRAVAEAPQAALAEAVNACKPTQAHRMPQQDSASSTAVA
jgi:hypothetical protein